MTSICARKSECENSAGFRDTFAFINDVSRNGLDKKDKCHKRPLGTTVTLSNSGTFIDPGTEKSFSTFGGTIDFTIVSSKNLDAFAMFSRNIEDSKATINLSVQCDLDVCNFSWNTITYPTVETKSDQSDTFSSIDLPFHGYNHMWSNFIIIKNTTTPPPSTTYKVRVKSRSEGIQIAVDIGYFDSSNNLVQSLFKFTF